MERICKPRVTYISPSIRALHVPISQRPRCQVSDRRSPIRLVAWRHLTHHQGHDLYLPTAFRFQTGSEPRGIPPTSSGCRTSHLMAPRDWQDGRWTRVSSIPPVLNDRRHRTGSSSDRTHPPTAPIGDTYDGLVPDLLGWPGRHVARKLQAAQDLPRVQFVARFACDRPRSWSFMGLVNRVVGGQLDGSIIRDPDSLAVGPDEQPRARSA
jgi:hypothetical protein